MESSLGRAWNSITRYPLLMLVPLTWDGLTLAAGLLFQTEALWQRGNGVHLRFVIPSELPSGRELLQQTSQLAPNVSPALLLGGLLLAILGALAGAGFLHLAGGALSDIPPTWDRFVEGINRYGAKLVLWKLIVSGLLFTFALVATVSAGLSLLLLVVGMVAALVYYLVPFLLVVEELSLGEALSRAPGRLGSALVDLMVITLVSVLCSLAFSFILSGFGMRTLLLASPLWAFSGSLFTLAVVAAIQPVPARVK